MPRFPTYERQVGLSGGSTASFASDSTFTAPARALGGLGDAVAGVGDQFAAVENKIRQTQDDTWFTKARAETVLEQDAKERELRTGATGEAGNYTPQARGTFDEIRKSKVAAAPSQRAAQMFEQWATGYDVDVTRRSATFQAESELAKRTSDFADAMNLHAQAILADPSQFDAVHKRAMDDFEGAKQWMTPEQETVARAKVDHDLKLARAKSLVEFAPEDFLAETGGGAAPVGGAAALLRKFEGFRTTPYWDVTAYRTGYGSDTVTLANGTVRKVTPGMKITQADAERDLERRISTEFEPGARNKVGDAAWNALSGNAKAALVSVAYNYGSLPNSVVKAVRSGNTEAIAGSVAALGSNKDRRRQEAAIIRGGGEPEGINVVGKPEYEGLSVDELLSLQNRADSTIKSNQAVAYSQLKDSFSLGIQTGNIISEDQILGSGLDDGDKATLISQFRTARKDDFAAVSFVKGITDKNLSVDPFDSEARKNADNAAKMVKEQVTPEQYQSYTEEVARQTGLVSKDVVNEIRKGLQSTNAQEVAAAAQRASRISSIDPAALGRRDGGSEVQKATDDFSFYVNKLNLSPEDAARRMIENASPEKKLQRKAIEPAAKEFVKEVEKVSLANEFQEWFSGEPDLGFSPGQELGIKAEFVAIAEDQFFAANGDPEIAKNRAVEEMKRLYGVTGLTGRKVIMKHPPEKYWPKLRVQQFGNTSIVGDTPSLDYARIQLGNDLTAMDPAIDMDSVQLVTTPGTDAMVKRGEMPGYAVLYKDGNGVLQTLPGQLWRPDPAADVERQGVVEQIEQAERVESARQEHERIRTQNKEFADEDAAAEQAREDTVGDARMKAQAAEAARENFRARKAQERAEIAEPAAPSQEGFGFDNLGVP